MAMARWSCDRETKNRARQHCHGGTIHDARNLTQDRRNTQMFTRKEAGRNIDQPGPRRRMRRQYWIGAVCVTRQQIWQSVDVKRVEVRPRVMVAAKLGERGVLKRARPELLHFIYLNILMLLMLLILLHQSI